MGVIEAITSPDFSCCFFLHVNFFFLMKSSILTIVVVALSITSIIANEAYPRRDYC